MSKRKFGEDPVFDAAAAAISHVLNAIEDDPRKYWLLGEGTESYSKLCKAASLIWEMPLDAVKARFRPRTDIFEHYCAQKHQDEELLRYCRDRGIKKEGA